MRYQKSAGVAYLRPKAVTHFDKLPKAAREYLAFVEKESGARIGVVSTGPGREQTLFVEEFVAELKSLTEQTERALAIENYEQGPTEQSNGRSGGNVDGESGP